VEQLTTYVGLDVHKEAVAVALADEGKRGEVREHGKVANTPAALAKLASKLAQGGRALKFCYEAGPCGYGIQRQLSTAGLRRSLGPIGRSSTAWRPRHFITVLGLSPKRSARCATEAFDRCSSARTACVVLALP
jgi:hypothetical protein